VLNELVFNVTTKWYFWTAQNVFAAMQMHHLKASAGGPRYLF